MKILACLSMIFFSCISVLAVFSQKKTTGSDNSAPKNGSVIDFSSAHLVLAPGMSGPEKKAAQMLVEEIEKRSNVRWAVSEKPGQETVYLGQRSALVSAFPVLADKLKNNSNDKPEGYRITTLKSGQVVVAGNDA